MIGMRRKARRDAAGAGVSSSFGPPWGRPPTCPGIWQVKNLQTGQYLPVRTALLPVSLVQLSPGSASQSAAGVRAVLPVLVTAAIRPHNRAVESCAMHCLYCGRSFRLASRIFNDPDFCRPPHRWKFHKRLDTAIHFIQRSNELHPAAQPGFRSEAVFFDFLHQPTVLGLIARAPQFGVPALRVAITSEAPPVELLHDEETAETGEPVLPKETMERRTRAEHLSAIMTQLRADVHRRRSEARRDVRRTLAPVVEFRPATPDARESSLSALSAALSADQELAGRRPAPLQALRAACT